MALSPIFQKRALKSAERRGNERSRRFSAKQLPSSEALKEKVVSEQLKNIYADREGRVRDLSHLERARGFSWIKATFVLVLFGIVVSAGWWGITSFQGTGTLRFGEEQMELTIEIPKTVVAGEVSTITMRIVNRSSVTVSKLDLLVQYPSGFQVIESLPSSSAGDARQWKLSDLPAGSSTDVVVKGRFWASPPTTQQIRASLVFSPENLRASFRAQAQASINIDGTVVAITVQAPDRLSLGQQGKWDIKLTNTSRNTVENINISVLTPQQFLLEKTTPDAAKVSGIEWNDVTIAPDTPTVLTFKGTFVDTSPINDSISRLAPTNAKEFRIRISHGQGIDRQPIGESLINAVVTQNAFSVRLRVNGSLSQVSVSPPSTVSAVVDVINRGSDPVTDIAVSVRLQSRFQIIDLVDLSQVSSKIPPSIEGTTMHWDKRSIDRLAFVRGGETVSIPFDLPIRAQAQGSLEMSTQATYSEKGANTTAESNTATIVVATRIDASIAARYFTDDNLAFGTGPIPPRVGSATTIALLANITKPEGDYKSVEFSFALEPGVQFIKGSSTTGSISFDAFTRRVVWSIPIFPEQISSLSADVRVSVTPMKSDIGSVLRLANTARLKAVATQSGASTERVIVLNATTNLEGDPQVEGKGTVVEN